MGSQRVVRSARCAWGHRPPGEVPPHRRFGHFPLGRLVGDAVVLSADSPPVAVPYPDGVPSEPLRGLWAEQRAPDAEGPTRRDVALVAVVVLAAALETLLREGLVWPIPSLAVALVGAAVLPWRRVQPLVTTTIAIGVASAVQAVAVIEDVTWDGLGTAIFFLVLPYSIGRWGSGREAVGGAAVFAVPLTLTAVAGGPMGDVVGGAAVVLLAGAIGVGVRYRTTAHRQQLAQIRLQERAELARELHDTVAHHVSAIAVQAQAGRALMDTDTAAVAEVLAVVEEQASRTLEELRAIVGALRDNGDAEVAPQRGVADIDDLVTDHGTTPVVVERHGALDALAPSLDAAIYRVAQEAVTNARRHARQATVVRVGIHGGDERVTLTVDDDGDGGDPNPLPGYGLAGMSERTRLLGGTFSAGRRPDGGWNVTAVFPRGGHRR
ncbi:MAG: sensor histidine kinase [Acidimicrobiia bacterium]|nr:sensor histidine kinase [Acidimicrobiia bacterium]